MATATEERKTKVGDKVMIVTADKTLVEADVTKVSKTGLLDVEFEHNGAVVIITSSPNDPTGAQPDSWHTALEKARQDAAATQPQT